MKAEDARLIVDAFANESPEAYKLALAASLAARVEPELVRAYRLNLFPGVEPGAEADLWFSPLVQSQTPLALEFEPETLELLRGDLGDDQELLQRAWQVLEAFHVSAPFALRLQEELTWLGLSRGSNPGIIEERLHAVLNEVRAGRRAGLARWASRALPSLPEKARETEAARRLSVVVGMQTGIGPVLSAMPSQGVSEDWLSEVTATRISRVKVGVRLLKNDTPEFRNSALVPQPAIKSEILNSAPAVAEEATNAGALPMLIEFSYPPSPSAEQIEVPDTYRLLIEVSWVTGERRLLRQLSLLPDETQRVEVGYGEVNIRTALGDIITIRPRFDYDFMLLYSPATEEWAKRLLERLERQDWQGKTLRFAVAAVDSSVMDLFNQGKLEADFAVSRKIGWAISTDSNLLWLEPFRPEPIGQREWLIPIKVGEIGPFFFDRTVIDFSGQGGFEDGFRSLWREITGEELPQLLPSTEPIKSGVRIFISYVTTDKRYRDLLLRHVEALVDQGLLANPVFNDELIRPGQDWKAAINRELETAQLILLLISPAYLQSSYAGAEVGRAMERRESGDARVIPVILVPSDWEESPFAVLEPLPTKGKPISEWSVPDEAFANIVEGIRRAAEQLQLTRSRASGSAIPPPPVATFMMRRDSDGRDLVERLKAELAPGRKGVIALWGTGGIGKTTIAAEAARQLRSAYDGRIVWSSAFGRSDYGLSTLLDDIATQLGNPDLPRLDLERKDRAVTSLLERSSALVVLDDYESIASDEKIGVLLWLQRTQCAALITTREFIDKARNIGIRTLSQDEGEEMLKRLSEQSSNPQFFDRTIRQRIYQAASGNPAVMQWVVTQAASLKDPGVVLNELAQGKGDIVLAVFDRAFDLPQFSEDGRAVVMALSLFVPSAEREALAEVGGFSDDSGRLNVAVNQAVALSFIETTADNHRLTLSGLTRDLARARLSNDKRADDFNRRFVEYFRHYAVSHADPTTINYEALDAEKDNLLSAVDTAVRRNDWGSVLMIADILATPASGLLAVRGYLEEALQLTQRALMAARSLKDEKGISRFSLNLATMLAGRGELDDARGLYKESLEISRKLDDQSGVAVALNDLGVLAQEEGNPDEARRFLNESLEIYRQLNNHLGVATNLHQLGFLAQDRGELNEARRLYEQSLQISNELGDQRGTARTLHNIGTLAEQQGALDEAQRYYDQSLKIARELGDQTGIASTLRQLGMLAQDRHELEEARRLYEESLTIYRQLDNQRGIASVLHQHGLLAEETGDKYEARRLLEESLKIYERLQSPNAERVRRALTELESAELE
jgi:tetratricopeptide (TPR) repeat protein